MEEKRVELTKGGRALLKALIIKEKLKEWDAEKKAKQAEQTPKETKSPSSKTP